MTTATLDKEAIVNQILDGDGIAVLEGYFDRALIDEARERTYELAAKEAKHAWHMPGMDVPTHQGVWGLLAKGEVYQKLAADPGVVSVLESVLGEDVMLSSIGAKVLLPGAPAQKPHMDYPYCDLYEPQRWPRNLNASFLLEVEVIIMLDDFTEENGATAVLPGSSRECRWPDPDTFRERRIQITGPAGTLLMFPGTTWHAGQSNRSTAPRAAILSAYTAKCVRPLEDLLRTTPRETLDALPDRLKRLLGYEFHCPPVMVEES